MQNEDSPPQNKTATTLSEKTGKMSEKAGKMATAFMEKQSKDLVFYLSMAIIFVELLITLVALCYGIVTATTPAGGGLPQFNFPWIPYLVALVVAPALLLLMVHLTGVGLFRSLRGHEEDQAWEQKLPERIRRVYTLVQGAPTVVLLLGVIILGALLFFVDGALGILMRLAQSVEVYLPWILSAIGGIVCVGLIARYWFAYRSDRLAEEYAFRREMFEKTGVIIVDRGSVPLSPGADGNYALPAAQSKALPQSKQENADAVVFDLVPDRPAPTAAGASAPDLSGPDISGSELSNPDLAAQNSSVHELPSDEADITEHDPTHGFSTHNASPKAFGQECFNPLAAERGKAQS